MATQEYLQAERILTQDLAVLLILDEVQAFRLDTEDAQPLYGFSPELTA